MRLCLIGGGRGSGKLLAPAIEAQGARRPLALIIPSACSTQASYERRVPIILRRFEKLGIAANVLHGFEETPTSTKLDDSFGLATMMYIIGGNSPYLYDTMRNHTTDQRIRIAASAGKLLAGTSAGALSPFKIAHVNPSENPEAEEWDFALQPMLDLIDAAAAVHANQFDKRPSGAVNKYSRLQDFVKRFTETGLALGFAIDNNAAIHATPETVEVLSNVNSSTVHVLRTIDQTVSVTACREPEHLQELSCNVFSKTT